MAIGTNSLDEDQRRAEVFDALSHPTRILILKALSQEPLGFADLKKKLGIESSGHLQHHLGKLGGLVKTDEYGKYGLSDEGKDALLTVETVEKTAGTESNQKRKLGASRKGLIWKTVAVVLALALTASLVLVVAENATLSSQAHALQGNLTVRDLRISGYTRAVGQMDNVLSYSRAVLQTQKPQPQNLTLVADGKPTKIILLSTDIGYVYRPTVWPVNTTFGQRTRANHTGSMGTLSAFEMGYIPKGYNVMAHLSVEERDYLIIGVTIRNDYTLEDALNSDQNAPIGNQGGSNVSFVSLAVKLFQKDNSVVKAEYLNFPFPQIVYTFANSQFQMQGGETKQAVFYLSPSSLDFDHYEVYVSSVTAFPPP